MKSTNDSDLRRANICLKHIVGYFTNAISDRLTILQVNRT